VRKNKTLYQSVWKKRKEGNPILREGRKNYNFTIEIVYGIRHAGLAPIVLLLHPTNRENLS
jgi:hypothetical protein